MTAPTPMSDERLAELERLGGENLSATCQDVTLELVAEVHRGREFEARLDAALYDLDVIRTDRDRARSIAVALKQQVAAVRRIAEGWSEGPCLGGYRLADEDDSDSECLHCASDVIRRALDGGEQS